MVIPLLVGAVGCGRHPPPQRVLSNAVIYEPLPSEQLVDWVSYGDQMSVVDVVSEQEMAPSPPPPGETPASEESVGRTVTVRIEATVWRRTGAPMAPELLTWVAEGWTRNRWGRTPFLLEDRTRVEVGHSYLVVLTRLDDGPWYPLSGRAVLPLDARGVVKKGRPPLGHLFVGKTSDEVGQILEAQPADPAAITHRDLPPQQRLGRVRESAQE